MMNQKGRTFLVLMLLTVMILFSGCTSLLSVYDIDTTTSNKEYGGITGTGELLGPNNRKGYIMSYKPNGLSETVVCQGKVEVDTWAWGLANGTKKQRNNLITAPVISHNNTEIKNHIIYLNWNC